MKTQWIVVADEAIARILTWPEVGDELDPVEEMTDPDAHARKADMRHDAQGRRGGSVTASAGDDEERREASAFARRLADRLARALEEKRYDELCLIAAPRFLGLLRPLLSNGVAKAVGTTIDKDLVHESNADLAKRLAKVRPRYPVI